MYWSWQKLCGRDCGFSCCCPSSSILSFYCRVDDWTLTVSFWSEISFFFSVERNHFFPPNYTFSSLPLHRNSLGKKNQPPEQIFFLHSCCFGKIRKKCHPLGKSVKQISNIQFENVHLKVLYLHLYMLVWHLLPWKGGIKIISHYSDTWCEPYPCK